jgi:hypothetical protein
MSWIRPSAHITDDVNTSFPTNYELSYGYTTADCVPYLRLSQETPSQGRFWWHLKGLVPGNFDHLAVC